MALLARFKARLEQNTARDADTMKDWPNELRMNAAAARLAPALYAAHNDYAHGCEPEPWPTLKQARKHFWVQQAERAIRGVR